ncbi:MAG: peptide ABC transporter substrate-binding protein [Angelakisella sp.]|nr:peptide ABC transporter substrate-binding protein [Angelakisella sp.]
MEKRGKWLALALAAMMIVSSLAGCGSSPAASAGDNGSSGTPDKKVDKVFRFATNTEPTSIDPQFGNGEWITNVTCAIFEGLVRRYNGEIIPGIAESWKVSDDGLTYTFTLRESKWSDGTPLVAQDFVDSWNLLIQRATPMTQFTDFFTVDGKANAKALDDKTLEVTLNSPIPFMLEVFTTSALVPVRTDIYAEKGDGYYQGVLDAMNGPFVLTEWKANDVMVLEPNPEYWDASKVNLTKVEIYTVKDDQTQVNMYDGKEIDMVKVPTPMFGDYEDKGLIYYNDGANFYIQFTTDGSTDATVKYLKNRDFIEAVSACIDREDFVNSVYDGAYQPTNEFVPPSATGYNGKNKGDSGVSIASPFAVKADLALAKTKLDAALAALGDTVDTMPTFTLVVSDKADRQTAAQYVQDVCSKIGIKFKIDTIPGATFWPTMREGYRYDFALAGSGPDVDDASTFLKVYDGKGKYADTFMRWQSPDYAELLKQSWLVGDEERTELLANMEDYLLAQGPVIPLYFTKAAWMLADGFTNINRNMTGAAIDFVFADKN